MENQKSPVEKNSRFRRLRNITQPKTLLIVFIVLAIAAVAVAWAGQWYEDYRISQQTVELVGEGQYFEEKKNELIATPPAETASLSEKLKYYDTLRYTYTDLGDFKAAAAALDVRLALSKEGMTSARYISAAQVYHKAGKKAQAIAMLDAAEQVLPGSNQPDQPVNREAYEQRIAELREEYES